MQLVHFCTGGFRDNASYAAQLVWMFLWTPDMEEKFEKFVLSVIAS